jgi:hypothetical protein
MSLLEKVRQGFRFVLMSMGISSPNRKTPSAKPAPPRR